MTPEKRKDIPQSVVSALSQGQKMEAIKLLRNAHGIGLKEAKDRVEEYLKSRPDLSAQLEARQQELTRVLLRWLAFVALLAIAGFYWGFVRKNS